MRLSIRVLVPSQVTAEDCEQWLKNPAKFMKEHGGEINVYREKPDIDGHVRVLKFCRPMVCHSWVAPEVNGDLFASPDTTERRS